MCATFTQYAKFVFKNWLCANANIALTHVKFTHDLHPHFDIVSKPASAVGTSQAVLWFGWFQLRLV
jgi:hypothetical protein